MVDGLQAAMQGKKVFINTHTPLHTANRGRCMPPEKKSLKSPDFGSGLSLHHQPPGSGNAQSLSSTWLGSARLSKPRAWVGTGM